MKIHLTILFIIINLFSINQLQAQWQQTFGPFGSTVMHLAVGNGYVFASTDKIHRSTDNGLTWEQKGNGIWQWSADALFISDGRVFAGCDGNDVGYFYYSDDWGENWTQLNTIGFTDYVADFTKLGSKLFFCTYRTYQNGIYMSTDNGLSWSRTSSSGLPNSTNKCLLNVGGYLFLGTDYGVYRSSDEGANWQLMPNPDNVSDVNSITVRNNTLFVVYGSGAYYSTAIYKSDNYGSTYVKLGDSSTLPYIRNVFADGSNVYMNTDNGIFRSSNDGTNWTHIALEGEICYSLAVSGGNLISGTRSLGVFTSTDNGVTCINTGYIRDISITAAASYNDILIASTGIQEGLLISRNNGNTFTEYENLSHSDVNCLAIRGSDFFAGTRPAQSQAGIFKSSDLGITWQAIGLPDQEIYSICFKDNYLFAGSFSNGVYRTSNEGASWNQMTIGIQNLWIKTLAVIDTIIYAGTNSGAYVSSNNGANWSLIGFQNISVNSLIVINSKLYAGTANGVHLLETNGSWTLLGLENKDVHFLQKLDTDLFACAGVDLLISKDYGITWSSIKQGITPQLIYNITFNNTYAFAGTSEGGIWRRPIAEVIADVKDPLAEIPANFRLNQNYPNPFNPTTIISYSLPHESSVKISVYNLIGEAIWENSYGSVSAGYHECPFGSSSLSSGVYFYSLTASSIDGKENYKETKKMILMR